MNKERLLELAAHLRKAEVQEHFDLGEWFWNRDTGGSITDDLSVAEALNDCGTVACIAGHAVALFDSKRSVRNRGNVLYFAQEALELTPTESYALFIPTGFYFPSVTAEIAADVVEHFASTGEVDFARFGAKASPYSEAVTQAEDV